MSAPFRGPFEDRADVAASPLVATVRQLSPLTPAGRGEELARTALLTALDGAGVPVGEYDRRIAGWLAGSPRRSPW
jgi:hypothetical protein